MMKSRLLGIVLVRLGDVHAQVALVKGEATSDYRNFYAEDISCRLHEVSAEYIG